jgi:hypothetical protein
MRRDVELGGSAGDAPLSGHFRNRRARRAEAAGVRRAAWTGGLKANTEPPKLEFKADAWRDGDSLVVQVDTADGKRLRINFAEDAGWALSEKMVAALYAIRDAREPVEPEPISAEAAAMLAEAEANIVARAEMTEAAKDLVVSSNYEPLPCSTSLLS